MNKKFDALDLLRFALACYLMVFHSIHQYPQSEQLRFIALAGLGGFATSTFFILSGFILTHVYFGWSEALRGGRYAFFVKRLSNLYAIHLIAFALLLLVSLSGTRAHNAFYLLSLDESNVSAQLLPPVQAAINWLANVLLIQAWNPLYSSINPPSWSLSALLFFYFTFPVAAPKLLAAKRPGALAFALWLLYLVPPVIAAAMHWYGPAGVGTILHNPMVRVPEFFLGILTYRLFREHRFDWMTRNSTVRACLAMCVVLSFVAAAQWVAVGPEYSKYVVHNGALTPAEIVLVALCAGVTVPHRFARWSSRLGNAALALFAIHGPIFLVSMKVLKLATMGESPWWCTRHFGACVAASKHIEPSMATYPLYLIGTAVAAVYFQERCVVPLRDWIRARLLTGTELAHSEPP